MHSYFCDVVKQIADINNLIYYYIYIIIIAYLMNKYIDNHIIKYYIIKYIY